MSGAQHTCEKCGQVSYCACNYCGPRLPAGGRYWGNKQVDGVLSIIICPYCLHEETLDHAEERAMASARGGEHG